MWSLLKAAYGEYGSSSPRSCVGNLDPILCARGAHLRELHKSACAMGASFAADLLRILLEDDGTKSPSDKASCIFFLPTEPRQIKFTNAKYASHFRDLLEWRLLEECIQNKATHKNTAIQAKRQLSVPFPCPSGFLVPGQYFALCWRYADESTTHWWCGSLLKSTG